MRKIVFFLLGSLTVHTVWGQQFRNIQQIKASGANAELLLYQSADDAIVEFRAINRETKNFIVEVNMQLDNMKSEKALPVKMKLPASTTRELKLFQISRIDANKAFYFRNLSWYLHADFGLSDQSNKPVKHNGIYNLMWVKGKTFRIDNGFNSYGAHRGDWAYALDFKMPEGTEICAAREGVVTETESKFSVGGNDPALGDKANYIYIKHEDGSIGRYLHFRKGGVRVKPGDKIKLGQKIGSSGNTGWSTDPHLHFDVIVPKPNGGYKTVPFKLRTKKKASIEPVQGMSLTQD
ncbi:MAG TPA: M23 family metallopeptidase [Turneriella sp.]|nr:M23 family metallopeptidase [Turneriella sp.]